MDLLNNLNSEMIGFMFVTTILGLVIGSVFLLGQFFMRSGNAKSTDLIQITDNNKPKTNSTCVVTYSLEHYDLQFELIDKFWYSSIKVGAHVSPINEIKHTEFRNVMMETLLFLKVKPTNQYIKKDL